MGDSSLYTHPRLRIVDRGGYVFTSTTNSVVYLLPYRLPLEGRCFLAHREVCPAHGPDPAVYAITGQCEPDQEPLDVAVEELFEEAGIRAEPERFQPLGTLYLTKQADTQAHLFAVDVTDLNQGFAISDGSYFERGASYAWLTRREALASPCVGLPALIARAGF
jgi:8-oxo-dGTP pyrophosphatase MutT (NUDIX family)